MSQVVRIVVATGHEDTRSLIARVAERHPGARVVADVDDDVRLMEMVNYRRPQLVFLSSDLSDMRGYDVADRLSRRFPGLFIAMMSTRQNMDEIRQAMKAGARECLFEPLSEEAVLRVIADARNVGQSVQERRGTIIAIMSSKGGVGKSTLSTNMAIALKQHGAGRVALVDGDLYFGDLAVLLNIKPERTIHELNAALDAEIADRFLYRHASGVEVLAAPLAAEQAEGIPPERFRAILGVLQSLYDCVVVDATVSVMDTMLATLDVADLAVVLTTLDVVCLKDVGQVVSMLDRLRFPAGNIRVVGNMYDERISVAPRDAERTLGTTFATVLPRDDRVIIAANHGVPIILEEPNAPFSRKVQALAKTIAAEIGRADRVATQTAR